MARIVIALVLIFLGLIMGAYGGLGFLFVSGDASASGGDLLRVGLFAALGAGLFALGIWLLTRIKPK